MSIQHFLVMDDPERVLSKVFGKGSNFKDPKTRQNKFRIDLDIGGTKIGRGYHNDIVIPDPIRGISIEHGVINIREILDGVVNVFYEHVGVRGESYINGNLIYPKSYPHEAYLLENGDRIDLDKVGAVSFVYRAKESNDMPIVTVSKELGKSLSSFLLGV